MKVTLTGGSGFVGSSVSKNLMSCEITSLGRNPVSVPRVANLLCDKPHRLPKKDMPPGEVFLHLAGYSAWNKAADFHTINVDWTKRMAELALQKGYRHFIFMSTAKVLGDYQETPITKFTPIHPADRYSESKLKAEEALLEFANDIAITVLRPPAVYGTPLSGGFKKLVGICRQGQLVPVSSTPNLRSFISVQNVVSTIQACLSETEHGLREFLIHENETLSTEEFIECISSSIQMNPKKIYLPKGVMLMLDSLTGLVLKKQPLAAVHRNFYIECDEFARKYNWAPLHSTREGVEITLKSLANQLQSNLA